MPSNYTFHFSNNNIVRGINGANFDAPYVGTVGHVISGIAHIDGLYCALRSENGTYTSTDSGSTWTYNGSLGVNGTYAASSNLICVNVGVGTYKTSTDGASWTNRTYPVSITPLSIACDGTAFCVCAESGVTYTSTDAINWTERTGLSTFLYATVSAKQGIFVASDYTERTAISTDHGATWTISDVNTDARFVYPGKIVFAAGMWWMPTDYGYGTSNEGLVWTFHDYPSPLGVGGNFFVAGNDVGYQYIGDSYISTDHGTTWTANVVAASGTYSAVDGESIPIEWSYSDIVTGEIDNHISLTSSLFDTVNAEELSLSVIVAWFYESISYTELSSNNIVGYGSYSDSVVVQETLTALFTQLVSESASLSESWFLGISTLIADVVVASGIQTSNAVLSNAIAEAVVAIELQQSGLIETISDSATAAEVVASLVTATQAIIEQVIAAELSTSYLILVNTISESSQATEDISIWQVLTQNIEEGATAFVHLNIGGESYTGWVMNTNNLAVSEYQGMNFNSLCKIGNRYFGASDIGVYELTGSTDSGTDIHTYIQSGLVDFGSTQQKRVSDSYIAADADGRIALGVAVSEKEGISRYWYEITPSMAAINNIELPIGRGLRGKYWKFDVASESMSEFDAITVLPYVLKRRI